MSYYFTGVSSAGFTTILFFLGFHDERIRGRSMLARHDL